MDRLPGDEDDPALAGLAVAIGSAFLTVATALLVADGPLAVFADGSGATLTIGLGPTVGWAFLAAHGVPVHVTAERWHLGGTLVQSPVVYAVPPVTLLVGGYLVARLDDRATVVGGARGGALVAVGYALAVGLAVFGTRVSVQSSYADILVRPDVATGLLAAVAYPVAFGGLGGVVAGLVHDWLETPRGRRVEVTVLGGIGLALAGAVLAAAL